MTGYRKALALLGSSAAVALVPTGAHATDGYFQNGTSVRDKGMAGSGVADPDDPLILASNPAGVAYIDDQIVIGASVFSPRRQFTGSGTPGFTPTGEFKSDSNWFVLPSIGWSHKLDDKSAIAIALYGNGGMNTDYKNAPNPACAMPGMPATFGPFCGGRTGVNLMQAFISVGYARKLSDNISIGVAPMMAVQIFKARGLAAFSYDMMGNPLTVDPTKLTNNGNSISTGFGGRVGIQVNLAPGFRLGASYQTEMKMSRFKKYAGLYENGGKFDIPSNFTVGASLDVSPEFTINADYRHINYSDVPAVSNPSTVQAQFGSVGGPGFGWKNVDEFKIGAEVKANDALTLRAGASFNNNPVTSSDATINLLAPGVSTRHYTVGATVATSDTNSFDFSLLYSPKASTTGIEITPAGPNPGHLIELQMHQFEFGVAWNKKL